MKSRLLVLLVCVFLIPGAVSALESFGGPILPLVCPLGYAIPGIPGACKCANQVSYVLLGPPKGGAFVSGPLTRLYRQGQPRRTGQWLLGQASINYYCVYSVFPLTVLQAKYIDYLGSSI